MFSVRQRPPGEQHTRAEDGSVPLFSVRQRPPGEQHTRAEDGSAPLFSVRQRPPGEQHTRAEDGSVPLFSVRQRLPGERCARTEDGRLLTRSAHCLKRKIFPHLQGRRFCPLKRYQKICSVVSNREAAAECIFRSLFPILS